MQASQETREQAQPFQELLYKIKTGIINSNVAIIAITEKDAYHRLLSYLRADAAGTMINNKTIGLKFCWSQVNNFRQKNNMCTCSSLKTGIVHTEWWQANESCMKFYRRHEWSTSYNFEAYQNDHAAVVLQFKDLIAKLKDPTTTL